MTFEELLTVSPLLAELTENMPEHIKTNFALKRFEPHSIIHQKDAEITSFGIVCKGQHRVINEFENGNIFMIEKNKAPSFIGEVTLLAGYTSSSVTIETITECLVMFISLEDFDAWVAADNRFLRYITKDIARKLYSASYSRGERQYYSVRYLVLKHLMAQTRDRLAQGAAQVVIKQTRQQIAEEMGLTAKTLNRTVKELKDRGMLGIQKGKVTVTASQFEAMESAAGQYVRQSRRGATVE